MKIDKDIGRYLEFIGKEIRYENDDDSITRVCVGASFDLAGCVSVRARQIGRDSSGEVYSNEYLPVDLVQIVDELYPHPNYDIDDGHFEVTVTDATWSGVADINDVGLLGMAVMAPMYRDKEPGVITSVTFLTGSTLFMIEYPSSVGVKTTTVQYAQIVVLDRVIPMAKKFIIKE